MSVCYECGREGGQHALICDIRQANFSETEKKVYAIVKDLSDRRGLGQEWDAIDHDIKDEIFGTWVNIMEGR